MLMPWLKHKQNLVHKFSEHEIIPFVEVLLFQNRGCDDLWNTKVLLLEKLQEVCEQVVLV